MTDQMDHVTRSLLADAMDTYTRGMDRSFSVLKDEERRCYMNEINARWEWVRILRDHRIKIVPLNIKEAKQIWETRNQ